MFKTIDHGTVEVFDVQSQSIAGYAFVDASDAPQEQRWVLYEGQATPPNGTLLLRRPSHPARRYETLAQWKKALVGGDLWKPDARYMKVHCETYPKLVPFEAGVDGLLNEGASKVMQDDQLRGFTYTTTNRAGDRSIEHWVLFDGFAPLPERAMMIGSPGKDESGMTLTDFLDKMAAQWQPGNRYAVCASTVFEALPDRI